MSERQQPERPKAERQKENDQLKAEPSPNGSADDSAELPGYAASMTEIERLLSEIEAEDVDIDTLLTKVTRAATLIKHCKGKLRDTETQVRGVLDSLEEAS